MLLADAADEAYLEPAIADERRVVRIVRREGAVGRVDGIAVIDVHEPDRVPPAAVDVDAAAEPAMTQRVRSRFVAEVPGNEAGTTATVNDSVGAVVIAPSPATVTLIATGSPVARSKTT
jgi:hypothetical protein